MLEQWPKLACEAEARGRSLMQAEVTILAYGSAHCTVFILWSDKFSIVLKIGMDVQKKKDILALVVETVLKI